MYQRLVPILFAEVFVLLFGKKKCKIVILSFFSTMKEEICFKARNKLSPSIVLWDLKNKYIKTLIFSNNNNTHRDREREWDDIQRRKMIGSQKIMHFGYKLYADVRSRQKTEMVLLFLMSLSVFFGLTEFQLKLAILHNLV